MKDEMKTIDTIEWAENIHYQFKTIQGIKCFEDLTHFLVGDFEVGVAVPINVVNFGEQRFIMTISFCEFLLETSLLTRAQKHAIGEYTAVLRGLPTPIYARIIAKLEKALYTEQ